MNFIACGGTWTLGAAGEIGCSGELRSYTVEEMRTELISDSLTAEDSQELLWLTIPIFAAVFGVLVIKKVL